MGRGCKGKESKGKEERQRKGCEKRKRAGWEGKKEESGAIKGMKDREGERPHEEGGQEEREEEIKKDTIRSG